MHKNFPNKGTHIFVSKGCTHPDYPPGHEGCVRVETKLIGYLFTPIPEVKGTKI